MPSSIHEKARLDILAIKLLNSYIVEHVQHIGNTSINFIYKIWKIFFFYPGYFQAKAKLISQAKSMQKPDWIIWL